MKRLISVATIFIAMCTAAFGQNVNAYKYSLVDDYLFNPAYVGTNDYYTINFGMEQRFSGLGDATPKTAYLSAHSRVGKGYLFNKDGKVNKFFSKFGNSAFGFQMMQYNLAYENETNIGITYGHEIKLQPRYKTKSPRHVVLALTPRLQWVSIRGLLTEDDVEFDPIFMSDDANTPLRSNVLFKADVAALFQTVHVDLGLSALGLSANKNKFDKYVSDSLGVPNAQAFDAYDTIYSPAIAFNGRIKHLKLMGSQEENYVMKFIPTVEALYMYKTKQSEYFVDLALENTFYKHIAGVRREVYLIGTFGLNVNHIRRYDPTTHIRPYISLDFKNFVFTYAYTYTIGNDIVGSGTSWGSNNIAIGVKLSKDRIETGPKNHIAKGK